VNEQDKDSDARNMEELGDVYKQTFDNIPAWGLFAALGMFVGAVYYRGNPVWQAVLMGVCPDRILRVPLCPSPPRSAHYPEEGRD
jgi:hypothetical protein